MDDPNVNMSTSLIIIKSSEDISGLDVLPVMLLLFILIIFLAQYLPNN